MNYLRYGFGFVALLAVLFVVSPFDLSLAQGIIDQKSMFGKFVQDFGTIPQGLLIVAAILVLVINRLRIGYPLLARASSVLLAQAILHSLIFCTCLKYLWGRTRPADLLAGGVEFAPFYIPNPGAHGMSFPSGHVAAALILLPVLYILISAGKKKAAIAVAFVTVFWVLPVAYGRMLYGAHFLTDVIFSIGTAFFCVPLSVKVGDWYLSKFENREPDDGNDHGH